MNLTAVTITVYFVGLVNFSGNGATREVVVPRATSAMSRPPVTLEVHRPDIVIAPLTAQECTALGGGPLLFPGAKCRLRDVTGKHITLPAGTPSPLDASLHHVPKLKALCPAISGIKREYLDDPARYAVRLTLDSGTLDTCADGAAWGSRLLLAGTDGKVTIEDKLTAKKTTVTLPDGATIHILNQPPAMTARSGAEHFWWHYVIAENATDCTAMPTVGPSGPGCPPALGQGHSGGHPAASGLGCSNSQYP